WGSAPCGRRRFPQLPPGGGLRHGVARMERATMRAMSRSTAAARLPLDEPVLRPSFRRERAAMKRGLAPVAGCDEAGRGPLAGPGVAAAVILDPGRIPKGLNGSKKLLPERRGKLYAKICANAEGAIAFGSTAR